MMCDKRVALMSIRPQYAHAILDGFKTVEFRKRKLSDQTRHVIIYSTSPEKRIVGSFTIHKQVVAAPVDLWNFYKDVGCISREDFFGYYGTTDLAVGIEVCDTQRFPTPFFMQAAGVSRPPQSYQYVSTSHLSKELWNHLQLLPS